MTVRVRRMWFSHSLASPVGTSTKAGTASRLCKYRSAVGWNHFGKRNRATAPKSGYFRLQLGIQMSLCWFNKHSRFTIPGRNTLRQLAYIDVHMSKITMWYPVDPVTLSIDKRTVNPPSNPLNWLLLLQDQILAICIIYTRQKRCRWAIPSKFTSHV